jgi:hypothetical protein
VTFVERTSDGAQVIATTAAASGSAEFTPSADGRIVAMVEQDGLPRRTIALDDPGAGGGEAGGSAGGDADGPGAGEADGPGGAGSEAGSGDEPRSGAPADPAHPDDDGRGGAEGATPGAAHGHGKAGGPARGARSGSGRTVQAARPGPIRMDRRRGGVAVVSWPAVRGARRYAVEAALPRGRRVARTTRRPRLTIRHVRATDRVRVTVRAIGAGGALGAPRSAAWRGASR